MNSKDGVILKSTSEGAPPPPMNQGRLETCMAASPHYRAPDSSPAIRYLSAVERLWGGKLFPVMSPATATGRLAGAALGCPETACTGVLVLESGARSRPWRNPHAYENLFCLDGAILIRYGQGLEFSVVLERFDMVSIPSDVRHEISNDSDSVARLVTVLSIPQGGSFVAIFDADCAGDSVVSSAASALQLQFDAQLGRPVTAETVSSRITRFATLVPYKKDLQAAAGIPPEATMLLSAGSVCPLIVPEGHVGRSRTAPMYGPQGLYLSIAECVSGDDGPPPHTHSDTQETFLVLDGEWDICAGFDNEFTLLARPYDVVAMPRNVMRTFRNRSGAPARLLVIIQGPEKMNDIVSYSKQLGDVIAQRFGLDTVDAYRHIKMTFDAEERLSV